MYQQVIQFGYPQFLAIMRNGKPFVIRKNGLHEQWYSVTHLRYDIAKLLFTDTDDRDYNYVESDVELYELIVVFTFGFKCRKVWFDGRLCWTMPSNAKEFPKYLAFHLRYNQMYLMFSKLRMERLDLENPQVDAGVIERPVSLKRTVQCDNRIVKEAKRVCKRKSKMAKTVIEPGIGEVDGGSTSLNMPRQTEPPRIEPIEQQSENCSIPQEMTLESCYLPSEGVRIDVLGKNDREILRLFQENWHKIILCNGYNSTTNNNIYRYKLDKKFLSKRFRRNCVRELIESIDFYKEQKIIVLGTLTKFNLYKLENNEWTKKEYEIPQIKLRGRGNSRRSATLSSDQYTIELSMAGDTILLVYRVNEGMKCVRVKLGNRLVWKNNNKDLYFIKTLVYNLTDGGILVETNILIKCTKVNNKWVNKHQIPFYLKHYAEDLGGLIPIYMDSLIQETNRHKYLLEYQNVNFDLIKYRENIVWRRNLGKPLPKSLRLYGHSSFFKFIFGFDGKFIEYKLQGNRLTEEHYPIPPIRLLTEDLGNVVTLSSEDYSMQFCPFKRPRFVYTLKNGVCTLVKYADRVIWNRNPGEKPLYIVYSQETGRIEVIFEDKILFANSKNPNSIVQTIKIPPELTLHKRNEQGETVQLSPLEYRVQTFYKSGLRYTRNNDVICTEVRHNNRVVWSHTDGDHKPFSFIYRYQRFKKITVKFHYKPSIQYQLQEDQWTLNS
ncbi:hypothetical protein TpMuguga_03g00485 [Theileria parva strain Muguga]|uniref:Uncharacterized protein n=1 Tax=Theileria parva TaxID=5875 RepID=Q4MZN2_THEPA|nr:uncharacterized protein TpMuguga_03g00485 [Theileria parva strain Muguga]EAN31229.1 hypothetical protein TpMuguga_03g00485 [Theileria parva strain Muguga]|eukprot:XP_763512.1 hypothetical protein [Theileria parva strain Muguga]